MRSEQGATRRGFGPQEKMRTCKIEGSICLAKDGEYGLKGLPAEGGSIERLNGGIPRVEKWVKDPLGSSYKFRIKA